MGIDAATWTNCHADIASSGHGRIIESFMEGVVTPSLVTLENEVQKWQSSDEGAAPFIAADAEYLLKATIESYCLSIQSFWERQIRGYLVGCARELRKDEKLASKIMQAKWEDLRETFQELRGLDLRQFDSYSVLDLLHLTGNACRHGEGKSAQLLFERCPDWWPYWAKLPGDADSVPSGAPAFSSIEIPATVLSQFAEAIVWFWDDAEYIYLNSLKSKHPSALRTMETLRARRRQRRFEQS